MVGVVHGDLGVKGVETLSAKRVNGKNAASPVLVQVGDAAQCIKVAAGCQPAATQHTLQRRGPHTRPHETATRAQAEAVGTYLDLKKLGHTVCFHGDVLMMWNEQWMPVRPPAGPPPPPAGPPTKPPTQTAPVPQAQLPVPPSERVA